MSAPKQSKTKKEDVMDGKEAGKKVPQPRKRPGKTTSSQPAKIPRRIDVIVPKFDPSDSSVDFIQDFLSPLLTCDKEQSLLRWMLEFQLLKTPSKCRFCDSDAHLELAENERARDKSVWICRLCNRSSPIRSGSFFQDLQCSVQQALYCILAWCKKMSPEVLSDILSVRVAVVRKIFQMCLETIKCCMMDTNLVLGGEGSVVLMDIWPNGYIRVPVSTADKRRQYRLRVRVVWLADTNHIPVRYWVHLLPAPVAPQLLLLSDSTEKVVSDVETVENHVSVSDSTEKLVSEVETVENHVSVSDSTEKVVSEVETVENHVSVSDSTAKVVSDVETVENHVSVSDSTEKVVSDVGTVENHVSVVKEEVKEEEEEEEEKNVMQDQNYLGLGSQDDPITAENLSNSDKRQIRLARRSILRENQLCHTDLDGTKDFVCTKNISDNEKVEGLEEIIKQETDDTLESSSIKNFIKEENENNGVENYEAFENQAGLNTDRIDNVGSHVEASVDEQKVQSSGKKSKKSTKDRRRKPDLESIEKAAKAQELKMKEDYERKKELLNVVFSAVNDHIAPGSFVVANEKAVPDIVASLDATGKYEAVRSIDDLFTVDDEGHRPTSHILDNILKTAFDVCNGMKSETRCMASSRLLEFQWQQIFGRTKSEACYNILSHIASYHVPQTSRSLNSSSYIEPEN